MEEYVDDTTKQALNELIDMISNSPSVTWVKPDLSQNSYRTIHQDKMTDWHERWRHIL